MNVIIKPYEISDQEGVIKCLQRNFNWMKSRSYQDIKYWMNPLWTYDWMNSKLDSQFQHGVVVLNEQHNVVGYLGFIFSLRESKGKKYKYLSPSYWALDDGYRIYLFQILKQVFKQADIIGDFTPIPSVEKILKTIFKFKTISTELYQFFPVPYFFKNHVLISKCDEQDLSKIEKQEIQDHQTYDIRCVKIKDIQNNNSMLVFYRVFNARIKRILPVRCIQILKLSGSNFLSLYTHEIVWKLQKQEKALLQCDSIFFADKEFNYPLKRIKIVPRQFFNKKNNELDVQPDFLYSELAMLNDKTGKHYLL